MRTALRQSTDDFRATCRAPAPCAQRVAFGSFPCSPPRCCSPAAASTRSRRSRSRPRRSGARCRTSISAAPSSSPIWWRRCAAMREQEREVLTQVIEARAKATQVQVNVDQLTDPEALKRFQEAQAQLSGALGRLHRGERELSRPQVEPELPGAAVAARGHREPHRGGAARLHPGGAGLQHRGPHLSRAGCGP